MELSKGVVVTTVTGSFYRGSENLGQEIFIKLHYGETNGKHARRVTDWLKDIKIGKSYDNDKFNRILVKAKRSFSKAVSFKEEKRWSYEEEMSVTYYNEDVRKYTDGTKKEIRWGS